MASKTETDRYVDDLVLARAQIRLARARAESVRLGGRSAPEHVVAAAEAAVDQAEALVTRALANPHVADEAVQRKLASAERLAEATLSEHHRRCGGQDGRCALCAALGRYLYGDGTRRPA